MQTQYTLLALCTASQLFFYYGWPLRPDRILMVLVFIGFLMLRAKGAVERFKIGSIEVCMIAFTALCGFALINGEVYTFEEVEKSTAVLQIANICFFPFFTYFIAKHLTYSGAAALNIVKLLAVLGAYLALTAFFERYNINSLVWPSYILDPSVGIHYGRSRGPVLNSVFLGMILVFCCMMMLILQSLSQRPISKLLLVATIILSMCAVYLTNTRGAWIGLAGAFGVVLLFKLRMRRTVMFALGIAFLGFVFGSASQFSAGRGTLFSKRQNTVVDREVNYKVAYEMGVENPIVGIGWAQMGRQFDKYYQKIGSPGWGGWDGNHNEYLGIFAQVGLIALALYCYIFVKLGQQLVITYRLLPPEMEFEKHFVVATLGCLLCYLIMACFSDIHSSPMHNNVVFLLIGISSSISSHAQEVSGSADGYRERLFADTGNVCAQVFH